MNFNRSFTSGESSGITPQVIKSLSVVVVLYLVLLAFQIVYTYLQKISSNRTVLLPKTYAMESSPLVINLNPNHPKSKPISLSSNERTGPEFSYSFFLNIQPNSFREEEGLLHIFTKGYPSQFPLLCPGVYMKSNTNTLRVYINTYKSWNTYCEVENFPIAKWVHVAIVCHSGDAEVHINGNLKSRLPFEGYQPYQNYENITCFSQRKFRMPTMIPSVGNNGFHVFGAAQGFLSRLTYFNYALSFSELQGLVEEGPSSELEQKEIGMPPPYLADTWWTERY